VPAAAAQARHPRAPPFVEPPGYARHRPESTQLYQLVEQHYPAFREMRAMGGRSLPDYIEQEFDAYLKCGRLEEGFLRVRCEHCQAEKLVAFSCMEYAWLTTDGAGGPLDDLIGHSITYRIAVGPRAGQKLFTLQLLSANAIPEAQQQGGHRGAVQAGGFSLHAGIDIDPGGRQKLERLCRYVSRPPVAVDRMALTASGQVRYSLKTPYRDGTTHIVLEPLDLMARLAALVPPPRMHLTRYHGVFAPHSKLRAAVTPAGRGKGRKPPAEVGADKPATPRHVAMNRAKRLNRASRSRRSSRRIWRTWNARRRISTHPSCRLGRGGCHNSPVCFEFEGWGACRWSGKQRAGSARADSGQDGGGRADSAGARGATAAGRRLGRTIGPGRRSWLCGSGPLNFPSAPGIAHSWAGDWRQVRRRVIGVGSLTCATIFMVFD